MKYVYPAIFQKDKESEDTWCVDFPDVAGAATFGNSLYEALEMAEDALAGMLVLYEDFKAGKLDPPMKNRIVEPTPIDQVKAEPDEFSTSAFVTLIKVDTDAYRKMLDAKKVSSSTTVGAA
ncbi:MAG: type II toxin-antitoxin system HicB family antitoxin [Selenomonadaceae bacterium]|nr:type II toxin-antitoxin system HicB family antitoxin [Selenomonadaceae bacterium]